MNIIKEEMREIANKLACINEELSDLEYDRDMSIEYIRYAEQTGTLDVSESYNRDFDKITKRICDLKFLRGESIQTYYILLLIVTMILIMWI